MDFNGFLGNDALKARLTGAFAAERVSHAYILSGPEGSGKHTLARLLCAAMQCQSGASVPCGHCPACHKAFAGVHPDIITVDDTEHKAMTVDPIRAAKRDLFIRPNEGKRKIYLIPRGQDMNESAQNALLKILEEPPSYGAFLILTTNAQRLLPTIRSRCVELSLGPVEQRQALPFLRSHCPDKSEQLLHAAYVRAGGYLGQALALLQSTQEDSLRAQFAAAYAARDRMALLRLLLPLEKQKRETLRESILQMHACVCAALAQRGGLESTDESAARLVASRTGGELLAVADALQGALDALQANAAPGAVIGYLTAKLR